MKEKIKLLRTKILLTLILILSAILNFANIGIEGYSNTFYAAGVKSMLMSLKNFFFASYDPAGFVTVDKPPLGFWIQTISAKIFGFSGWSIILPQAIAGVLSVWVLYYLIKRSFGEVAGLISALCLAVTPIFVAASRNNTIDNLLVLALVLACFAISIAAEKGKVKYLLFSLVIVGIGFNIKMVEAYMVAPAIYITYLLSASLSFKKRIAHLILGTIILLVVSLSWAVVVDSIPKSHRPFIGSSTNNTVMQLIVGHNGLQRVGLYQGNKGSFTNHSNNHNNYYNKNNKFNSKKFAANGMRGQNSNTGIFRLVSKNNMSDQIAWLLPFALIGFVVAAVEEKLKLPFDNKKKLSLLLWFTWLLTEFIYFSFSKDVTHTYYLTTMAPSIAALVGIGVTIMWSQYKENSWKKWILPIAIIINGLVEILMLSYNYATSNGYRIVMLITAILAILFSIVLIISKLIKNKTLGKLNIILVTTAFSGLLVAPTVWSFTPMFHKMNGSSPSAGLELLSSKQQKDETSADTSKLIKFLEAKKKNEKYLVEVPSATAYGSELILKTGQPVLTIGGYSGSDSILTVSQFKELVSKGEIRYAMVATKKGGKMRFAVGSSSSAIMNWIRKNGKHVPDSKWKTAASLKKQSSNYRYDKARDKSSSIELYDLKKKKALLRH